MTEALTTVAALVRRQTGVVVKDVQLPALAAAIERIAPEMGVGEFAGLVADAEHRSLLSQLVDEVTVQETYFFRELRELLPLDWRRLLDDARESGFGAVQVWVAGCATGEEAYSLGILASEALGAEATAVKILATDVSRAALERAAAGEGYSERSVRNLPAELRERYLSREGGRYRVRDSIRSMVRFRHHNLIADASPPPGEVSFDVIACRNVLIYFDLATADGVLRSLESALRPEGRLILGVADRLTTVSRGYIAVVPPAERQPRALKRLPRRPLGLQPKPVQAAPRRPTEEKIEDALLAADAGDLERAMEIVEALLAEDPQMADAYFIRGLLELGFDHAAAAVSLRRSLYLDPSFGLAAFELGRAQDASGNPKAARRAYQQALRTLNPEDERHQTILDQVDLADVADACTARLRSYEGTLP